jgi:hypothetical protein
VSISSAKQLPIETFTREYDLFAGIHLNIQDNFNIGFRYYFPYRDYHFQNIQLIASIPISKNPFEKKWMKTYKQQIGKSLSCMKEPLLVRLKTYNQVISSLEKAGNKKRAQQLREETNRDNKKTIAAFREYYRFSEVYFFYSSNSENVRAGVLEDIFLNDNLELDTSIHCSKETFYIAEISSLQADDIGQTSTGIEALVIKDDQFVQLKRPFPFYVKRDEFFLGSRSIEEMVVRLNFNLHEYFKGALHD